MGNQAKEDGDMSACSDDEGDQDDDEDEEKEPEKKQNVKAYKPNNFKVNKKIMEEEQPVKEKKPSVPRAPWRLKKEEKEKEKAAEEAAKKPKSKNKILASMPANWQEEEEKFFDSDFTYNP